MSAVIDKETGEILSSDGGELTVADRAKLALGGNREQLSAMAEGSKVLTAIKFIEDYDAVKNAESRLVKVRLNIRAIGKAARDDSNKFSKEVIVEENSLVNIIEPEETRLKALRFEWDEAIRIEKGREFAEAEAVRKSAVALNESLETGLSFGDGVVAITSRIEAVKSIDLEAILGEAVGGEAIIRKQELMIKKMWSLETLAKALEVAKSAEVGQAAQVELKRVNDLVASEAATKATAEADRLRKLASAPDAEKMKDWVNTMRSIAFPTMSTDEGQSTKVDILTQLNNLLNRVLVAAEGMSV